jgi:hypothetical protein
MRCSLRALALIVAALGVAACSGTSSSAYRTSTAASQPFEGEVHVYATFVPSAARPIGIVEVQSVERLDTAVDEFKRRVAELGGDIGVIDRYSTSFQLVTTTQMQTYSCGTMQQPRTCTRTVQQTREVATLHLSGRAMTTQGTL